MIDLYCTDPECDCRNIYIHVVREEFPGPIATITYDWENLTYYKEWMGGGEWLRIFEDILQTDKEYANRLQRHYRLLKGFIKDKNLH